MKTLLLAGLAIAFILQLEIVMLLSLDGTNLALWHAQLKFNQGVVELLTNQCLNK